MRALRVSPPAADSEQHHLEPILEVFGPRPIENSADELRGLLGHGSAAARSAGGRRLTVALARPHDGERATARQRNRGASLTLSGVFLTSAHKRGRCRNAMRRP